VGAPDSLTDGQLLERFLSQRDEPAFTALVRRHGPMVLGVCRRVLGNATDAEDVFQAAFLVLVRKAASLTGRAVLGDWLHGVARRIALSARRAAARRRAKERSVAEREAQGEEVRDDWLPLLDEELARLAEEYRLPLVLCDLEGRTRREAAELLGWPEGTVAGRLARGRALLARRLLQRARALSAPFPAALVGSTANAALPPALLGSTAQAAVLVAGGARTAQGALSAHALTLAQEVMRPMLMPKLKYSFALLLVVALGGAGIGAIGLGRGPSPPAKAAPAKAAPAPEKEKPPMEGRDVREGAKRMVREIDIKGFRAERRPSSNVARPTQITSAAELAKAFPDKTWQARIMKQGPAKKGRLDFGKEELWFFAWSGSGGDQLSFVVEKDEKGPVVVFRYVPGPDPDVVGHYLLYALTKGTRWRFFQVPLE
jgi:RNA polymerase sigma factor (sigma-70 family)